MQPLHLTAWSASIPNLALKVRSHAINVSAAAATSLSSLRLEQSSCHGAMLGTRRYRCYPTWLWHICKLLNLQVALLTLSHMFSGLEPVLEADTDRMRGSCYQQ